MSFIEKTDNDKVIRLAVDVPEWTRDMLRILAVHSKTTMSDYFAAIIEEKYKELIKKQ